MLPDKKAAVLADYRSKKATSATELSKRHGVSRSAVYRLLQAEAKATAEASTVKEEAEETPDIDSEDERKFLLRSDKFAEDLGLPATSSTLKNSVEDQVPAEEREEELDGAVDAIFGNTMGAPDRVAPQVLQRVFDRPLERRMPMPIMAPVPRIDRQDVIQRIIFNVQNFAPLLVTITGTNTEAFIASLHERDDEELSSTLKTLERTRSLGNIAAGFQQTFFMVAQATEMTSSFLGVKAHGFTERLRAEEQQVSMIMKELAIENWESVKAMDSPTMRLGVLFAMTLAQTDATNRLNDALKPGLSSRVSPGTEDAHKDL